MWMMSLRDNRGFTLMELMVASVVTVIVLGSAVALTSQIQNGYRRQLEGSAAEQEGRYALDWIGKYIRGAANNPTSAAGSECPEPGTVVRAVQYDPNDDDEHNDVRLMTDANPPDGLFGGSAAAGGCTQDNEDVTISLGNEDDGNPNTITFLDNNTGEEVSTRTDTVIESLEFRFRDSEHDLIVPTPWVSAVDPGNAGSVVYIEARITIRTRTIDPSTGEPATRELSQEFKIRSRGTL
jgi:prepilin-type N-terminal cleavage/methylation domain-containing protein